MSDAKSTSSHPLSGTQMRSKRDCHSRVSAEMTALFPALDASIRITMPAPINEKTFAANHSQSECQRCLQFVKHISLSRLIGHGSVFCNTEKRRCTPINAKSWRNVFSRQVTGYRTTGHRFGSA